MSFPLNPFINGLGVFDHFVGLALKELAMGASKSSHHK